MNMRHGTYIGPDIELIGEQALLQRGGGPEEVKAQFDNIATLPQALTHAWTTYPSEFWEEDEEGEYDDEEDEDSLLAEQPLDFNE